MHRQMKNLLPVFGLVLLIAVSSLLILYGAGRELSAANARLVQRQEVLSILNHVLLELGDAEAGKRGFLLTGESSYLVPYQEARIRAAQEVRRLREWSSKGTVPSSFVGNFENLIEQKFNLMEFGIAERRERGLDGALAFMGGGKGQVLMDRIRDSALRFEEQERADIQRLRERRNQLQVLRNVLMAVASSANLLFLIWAFRRIRQEIIRTEQQRRTLAVTLSSIGDGVVVADAEGRVAYLNPEAERLTGWSRTQAQGQALSDVCRIVRNQAEPASSAGRPGVLIARDGTERVVEDSQAPITGGNGGPQATVLVLRDMAERYKAEEAIRESEERLRFALETSDTGAWELDLATNRSKRSREHDRIFGYEQELEEWSTETFFEHVAQEDRAWVQESFQEAVTKSGSSSFECRIRRADGEVRWILVAGRLRAGEASRPGRMAGIVQDITERKRAEEHLSELTQRLSYHVDHSPLGVIEWGSDMRITRWSGEAERIFGWSAEEVLSKRIEDLDWVHPDDRSNVEEVKIELMSGANPKRFSANRNLRSDGSVVYCEWYNSSLLDDAGNLRSILSLVLDVTERKRTEEELEAARAKAEQAMAAAEEASKAKDHFLAVLSHELRTPLTPVLAAVSMLQRQGTHLDASLRGTVDMIRRNIEIEARLIDDLLDLTRIAQGKVVLEKQATELLNVINQAVEVCMPDLQARNIDLSIDAPDEPYPIEADTARLQQVFWNLLRNAVKFTPARGHIRIRCRREQEGFVVAEVIDSGEGITPELLPRLFDAFEQGEQRKHRQFGGLGLGLAIGKSLVELHGGTIEAFSEGPGRGATFRLRLRLREASPFTPGAEEESPSQDNGGKPTNLRLLLVEDHGDTAALVKELLELEGYRVQTAGDVATALDLAARHEFDVLLSDLGLPDGSGIDLVRQLRERGQTFPSIALSGYGQDSDIQRSREAGFISHVTKPVSIEQLLAVVEQVVSSSYSGS